MAAFELPLVALLSTVLTWLALLGRGREPLGWTGLLGPGAVAWIVGVQGLLFRRQPDYMVAYLVEARETAWIAYLLWCLAALGVAAGFSSWTQRAARSRSRDLALVLGIALLTGLLAIPLLTRLDLIGSTFEFREGVARPLSFEPAVGTLVTLTEIGSFLPVLGAGLLVVVDGIRLRRRARPS
jgi:hypothetical protein